MLLLLILLHKLKVMCDEDTKSVSVSAYKYDEVSNCALFDYTVSTSSGDTYEAHVGAVLDGNSIMMAVSCH